MRFFPFFSLFFLFCACNNDLSTIGHDLIIDKGAVEAVEYKITNTSTIRIDSFATSAGMYAAPVPKLLIGRTEDPITGKIACTPYFELISSGSVRLTNAQSYDSLTFNFAYTGDIWGDTTRLQTFYLFRMQTLPVLDVHTKYVYNNATVPHDTDTLAVIRFLPRKGKLKRLRFRMDDQLGRKLFNDIKTNELSISRGSFFLKEFNGLTLVADTGNTCLLGINSTPDSLKMSVHYSDGSNDYMYDFRKSSEYNEYTFLNIVNDAEGTPYNELETQLENLDFQEAAGYSGGEGQAVTQGLGGYLIKMRLPVYAANEKYQTIVKAELELFPQKGSSYLFNLPPMLSLYKSDRLNKIVSVLSDAAGRPVTGSLTINQLEPEKTSYTFDITDFYNTLVQQTTVNNNYILASIPLEQLSTSFNRLSINKRPVLKVYFAKYN
jgi:hypothetical protein